jgi:hypothetical protein
MEANTEAILHALALSDEEGLTREELSRVLPEPRRERKSPLQAVKNALSELWSEKKLNLPIRKRTERVTLPRNSDRLSVDLWDFFDLAAEGRYAKARALIKPRGRLSQPEEAAGNESLWKGTLDEFDRVRREVLAEVAARSGHARATNEIRERLLQRSLVPWTDPQLPIEEVREALEAIEFPWRLMKPRLERPDGTLQSFLVNLLDDEERRHPQRLLAIGGHGRGKTLAAIAGFLLLTDRPEGQPADLEARPIIFVDAQADGADPDFATDSWLESQLGGTDGLVRPILIMPHADSFFASSGEDLKEVLGWRLFRECDVLLCCSDRFYAQSLKYQDYVTHVVQLKPWKKKAQDDYAAALYGAEGRADLRSWRDSDSSGVRLDLCSVPLHLTFVLPLIRRDSSEREKISKPWHLLDQLARERLRAAHLMDSVDDYLNELAAVAHRFYVPGGDPETAIGFNRVDLQDFLEKRDPRNVNVRLEMIVNDTLITMPTGVSDEERFEHAVWGWFFAAFHLANTLKLSAPKESALRAFGKPFSPAVLEICEEMLLEWMPSHEEAILDSLRVALADGTEAEVKGKQRSVARKQLIALRRLLEAN